MTNKNSNPPSQHESSTLADSDGSTNESQSLNRSGCWWKFAILVSFFIVALIIAQRWKGTSVNLEGTKPVVISQGGGTGDASSMLTPERSLDPNLPAGAITATISQAAIDKAEHPFDPLLEIANKLIKSMDENVQDYSATLVSQVSIKGKLQGEKYVFVKIRNEHEVDGTKQPFGVYTLFLKPEANVGQEAIWVEGKNDGKLIAHTTGLMNVKRFHLDPRGSLAMDGNLHPIQAIGMRNLLVELKKTGAKAREHDNCQVTLKRDVDVNGRACTMFEAMHPEKRDGLEFHIARIYIDDELNVPIAYEGYLWAEKENEPLPLIEKYYYTDLKLNIGVTNIDFDPGNEEYDYPSW